jgi:hypothetical protein
MNKDEQLAFLKHQILSIHFLHSSGLDVSPLNDPNLIPDNSYEYSNDIYTQAQESLVAKGEILRYKTLNGIYNGAPCPYVWRISKEGIMAYQDEKYTKGFEKEASEILNRKTDKAQSWPKRNWWLVALLTLLIGWFADIGKQVFLQRLLPTTNQSKPTTPASTDTGQTRKK